jgi:methionyl aminopeptidase
VLKDGDIVNIDITVIKDGYHGDTSRMFHVGKAAPPAVRLCDVTYQCMWRGIRAVQPGGFLGDIGAAIQEHAENHRYSIVREYCGHGINRVFHDAPEVLHYGKKGTGERLLPGMIFTVEPMINAGRRETRLLGDDWTVISRDRSLSAQWEHTVLVTDTGFEVLTLSAGAPAPVFGG